MTTAPLDPSDPYARAAQTFPRLSDAMIERILPYGAPESPAAGVHLFTRGDRSVDFFLVLEGCVEIYHADADGAPNVFTVHEAGQFTGEIDLLNDREILVSGRVRDGTRVLRVPRAAFHRMVTTENDIGEIILRAFILRRVGLITHAQGGVVLIGPAHGADTVRLTQFLMRNGYPHRVIDTEGEAAAELATLLPGFNLSQADLPILLLGGGEMLRNPANAALADALGLTTQFDPAEVFDLVVVGAGPAGLAAAVYGASEGLSTVVVEALAPGGQAGTSSRIENYLGFPTGISGQALAGRAMIQAQKFGARVAVARAVTALECEEMPYTLRLEGRQSLRARAVVTATGARYRKLDVEGYQRFEGSGIHYAATAIEARLCARSEVVVVGGGNSAGQAAVFLSGHAAHVHLLVRGPGLAATMSDYLIQRITHAPRITLRPFTSIVALHGDDRLRAVTWRDQSGEEMREVSNVFVMIGAEPNTDWLRGCIDLDSRGFVRTGVDAEGRALSSPFTTTRPGVYAVGDVRAGSVKRVASGVGEGSVVVQAIHGFLNPIAT